MPDLPAGKALDDLVAQKVMGWRKPTEPYWNSLAIWVDEKGQRREETPDYSTEIADAWQVVERLMELGCNHFSLTWEQPMDWRPRWRRKQDPIDLPWMYAFNAPRHLSGSLSIGMPDPVVLHAETMPLAICRAALRAVGAA